MNNQNKDFSISNDIEKHKLFQKYSFYNTKENKYYDFTFKEIKFKDFENEESEFGWKIETLKPNTKTLYIANIKTIKERNDQNNFTINGFDYLVKFKNIYLNLKEENKLIPIFTSDLISQRKWNIFWHTTKLNLEDNWFYDNQNTKIIPFAYYSNNLNFPIAKTSFSWFVQENENIQKVLNIKFQNLENDEEIEILPKNIDGILTFELFKNIGKKNLEKFKKIIFLELNKWKIKYFEKNDDNNDHLLNPRFHFHILFTNIEIENFENVVLSLMRLKKNIMNIFNFKYDFNLYLWNQKQDTNVFYKDVSSQFYDFWITNHINYLEKEMNKIFMNYLIFKIIKNPIEIIKSQDFNEKITIFEKSA